MIITKLIIGMVNNTSLIYDHSSNLTWSDLNESSPYIEHFKRIFKSLIKQEAAFKYSSDLCTWQAKTFLLDYTIFRQLNISPFNGKINNTFETRFNLSNITQYLFRTIKL